MLILVLLGMYFDGALVFVTKSSLFFRVAVAILCKFINTVSCWQARPSLLLIYFLPTLKDIQTNICYFINMYFPENATIPKINMTLYSTSFRFYLPKFLMVGTLWFAALTMALLQESNELRDPSFSYQINTAHYQNFQVKQMLKFNYYTFVYLKIQDLFYSRKLIWTGNNF